MGDDNTSSSFLSLSSWQIVTQMKESEQELHEGAQTLECTTRGVLREQHLEKYISPQHWKSLMNGPIQVGVILGGISISLVPGGSLQQKQCSKALAVWQSDAAIM